MAIEAGDDCLPGGNHGGSVVEKLLVTVGRDAYYRSSI